ncbi:MAG: DUF302 domain-containing protein [Candidatus Thorarchaeota archaeon]|jgi:uncharacterized protein (DUF302 family)|nr:DUF302 domain-containing protein [Candidatus Thorarchaeota archaeon]
MVEVLRKELSEGFDEAVQKIEQICNDEGFTVMLTKSVDEIFAKKLGAKDYPRYTFILACAAPLAKMALDVSKDIGTIFPCSFVVYEDKGRIFAAHASIMKIAAETGLAPRDKMAPVIEETGKRVHKVWDRI